MHIYRYIVLNWLRVLHDVELIDTDYHNNVASQRYSSHFIKVHLSTLINFVRICILIW